MNNVWLENVIKKETKQIEIEIVILNMKIQFVLFANRELSTVVFAQQEDETIEKLDTDK